ncbi:MAG: hypothetical protein HYS83_02390 [Candidatus Blackburnbacteria bacterium]|nr:hypothetical protein [Candidatus Blackburnbacteria bacterium]
MSSHLFLKPLLIFVGGAIFSVIIVLIAANFNRLTNGKLEDGGKVIGEQIEAKVKSAQEGAESSIVDNIASRVLPVIAESPVLAPIFNTTRQVENTINSIKSLPDEQRNAVCRQICGD